MNYERGFKNAVEEAAQKVCVRCKEGLKLEDREIGDQILPCHPSGNDIWTPCSAVDLRQLVRWQKVRNEFYDEQIGPLLAELQAALGGNEELLEKGELLAAMLRSRSLGE